MTNKVSTYIRCKELQNRIISAEKAASFITNGMTVGLSGFTKAGDAKAVPFALIDRAKREPFKLNIFTGASLGSDIDTMMAEVGMVHKRIPFQADRTMRQKINSGEMFFIDYHLSHMAESIRQDVLEPIDVAVVEAVAITEKGKVIPTTSVGNSSIFIEHADRVIIEINRAQPAGLEGVHDIYELA